MIDQPDTSALSWRAAQGLTVLIAHAAANRTPMPYEDSFDLDPAVKRLIADLCHYVDTRRNTGLPTTDAFELLHEARGHYVRELNVHKAVKP